MSNPYFQFKQFTVWHDKCAMKVGTDGVLLGAWTNTKNATSILDIGTGTGLIAIMLAQKSTAYIHAIDIDEDAISQAQENCNRTHWHNRIALQLASLKEFIKNNNKKFDLVVTNPPFFEKSLKSSNKQRNIARHNDSLPFDELLYCVTNLLNKNGKLSIILPYVEAQIFIVDAALHHLYCNNKMIIKPAVKKKATRVLMEFSFERKKIVENEISILGADNTYTDEYKNLTCDYYLNF